MSITVESQGTRLVLNEAGEGSAAFSVTNAADQTRNLSAVIDADEPIRSWLHVNPRSVNLRAAESGQIHVTATVPESSPPGEYSFRVRAVADDEPDTVAATSQSISVSVGSSEEARGSIPWAWVGGAATVVMVGALIGVFLLTRGPSPSRPADGSAITANDLATGLTLEWSARGAGDFTAVGEVCVHRPSTEEEACVARLSASSTGSTVVIDSDNLVCVTCDAPIDRAQWVGGLNWWAARAESTDDLEFSLFWDVVEGSGPVPDKTDLRAEVTISADPNAVPSANPFGVSP